MFERIRKALRERIRPKDVYVRVGSTQDYKKYVNRGLSYENAELQKQVLLLRKALKEKDQYIKYLIQKIEGQTQEEAYQQEKQIEKIKKSREFKIRFSPEKPITIVSAYSFEPFRDTTGVEYPYLAGIKICHDAEYAMPYMMLMLKKKPKDKKTMMLRTQPKIWFPFGLVKLFRDIRTFFHTLKYGGRIEVLITPDGLFTGDRIALEVKGGKTGKRNKKNG